MASGCWPAASGGPNTVIDWVILGSGEFNKGQDCGSLQLQLVCRTYLALWQEKHAVSTKPFVMSFEVQLLGTG